MSFCQTISYTQNKLAQTDVDLSNSVNPTSLPLRSSVHETNVNVECGGACFANQSNLVEFHLIRLIP